MSYQKKDASFSTTKALTSTGAAVYSTAFDLGAKTDRHFPGDCEIKITAPALGSGQINDDETMTYAIQESSDGTTYADIMDEVIVQTGATGAAADTEVRRLPSDVERYVRVSSDASGTVDASGSSMTVELLF